MTKKKVIAMYAVFFAVFILVAGIVIYILKDKIWPPKPDPDPSTETSVSETTELSTSPTEPETTTGVDTTETTAVFDQMEPTSVSSTRPQTRPATTVTTTPQQKNCEHDWNIPDKPCVEPRVCSKCGYVDYSSITGHSWEEANCTKPKNCLTCGETVGTTNPNHHIYVNNICKYCGADRPTTTTTTTTVPVSETEPKKPDPTTVTSSTTEKPKETTTTERSTTAQVDYPILADPVKFSSDSGS